MNVREMAVKLGGAIVAGAGGAEAVVKGGYASDLLSDVIANAQEGDAWLTLQKHVNVVAVAQLKGLTAIVLVNGRAPEADTVAKAEAEGIPVVATALSTFDAAGVLSGAGLRGRRSV